MIVRLHVPVDRVLNVVDADIAEVDAVNDRTVGPRPSRVTTTIDDEREAQRIPLVVDRSRIVGRTQRDARGLPVADVVCLRKWNSIPKDRDQVRKLRHFTTDIKSPSPQTHKRP